MKTDPNKHCINFKQNLIWALIHDIIAHPFMALTGYSGWGIAFHNYTSYKAWVRDEKPVVQDKERFAKLSALAEETRSMVITGLQQKGNNNSIVIKK